jgi:hypothetical protein
MTRASLCLVWMAAWALGVAPVAAQDRPLPAQGPFLQEVRKHLQADDALQGSYTFVVTERTTKLDSKGRPGAVSSTVAESYPGLGPEEPRWERVVERDGRRVPDDVLRKKDAERQREAEVYARKLGNARERAQLDRVREKRRRDEAERVADVFRVFESAMVGREVVDGHTTIVFSLTPRPRAEVRTREGRWLRAFKGRAWISESDYELVRLDVEAVDSISIGLGVLARMHKGTTASFRRRKVNDEAWLPAGAEYRFSARVLLLKAMREIGTVEFSNYRKFSVDTSTTIDVPAASR